MGVTHILLLYSGTSCCFTQHTKHTTDQPSTSNFPPIPPDDRSIKFTLNVISLLIVDDVGFPHFISVPAQQPAAAAAAVQRAQIIPMFVVLLLCFCVVVLLWSIYSVCARLFTDCKTHSCLYAVRSTWQNFNFSKNCRDIFLAVKTGVQSKGVRPSSNELPRSPP